MPAAFFLGKDTATHGDWVGIRGSLYFFTRATKFDTSPLTPPAWMTSIDVSGITGQGWGAPTADSPWEDYAMTTRLKTNLVSSAGSTLPFQIPVTVADSVWRVATFCFWDGGAGGRSMIASVMDGSTVLASASPDADFRRTQWLSFAFRGNVAFKVAAASGVAFFNGMWFDPYPAATAGGVPQFGCGHFAI